MAGLRIFTELESERYCEDIFEMYEDIEDKSCTFEDIVLKYGMKINDSVIEASTFLLNLFAVHSIILLKFYLHRV